MEQVYSDHTLALNTPIQHNVLMRQWSSRLARLHHVQMPECGEHPNGIIWPFRPHLLVLDERGVPLCGGDYCDYNRSQAAIPR